MTYTCDYTCDTTQYYITLPNTLQHTATLPNTTQHPPYCNDPNAQSLNSCKSF